MMCTRLLLLVKPLLALWGCGSAKAPKPIIGISFVASWVDATVDLSPPDRPAPMQTSLLAYPYDVSVSPNPRFRWIPSS